MNEWLFNNPIAHRGLHQGKNIPENSLSAVRACIEKGIPAEVDLRQLDDGNIAVFHDETLQRMCGVSKRIGDYTCEELKELELYQSGEPIPLLRELLELVDGRIPLLIEVKEIRSECFESSPKRATGRLPWPHGPAIPQPSIPPTTCRIDAGNSPGLGY